ncbi:MAG: hypothetical protein ACP6IP_07875 [Candidatus Njordarchaeia archaeon]
MAIQTPSPDDIFKSWLMKLSDKKLDKYFKSKNVVADKKTISAAEYVKDVEKYALAVLEITYMGESKTKKKKVKVTGIENMKFYDHTTDKEVPIFKTLKLTTCEKCGGKGSLTCKKCGGKGYITCPVCGGTGEVKCDRCGGTGKIEITIVVEVEEGKSVKKKLSAQCPKCHGSGKVKCSKCKGLGKITCPNCEGSGKETCDSCGGYGKYAVYEVGKIRPSKGSQKMLIYPTEISKEIQEEIIKNIERAESIKLKESEIEEKTILEKLGYTNKPVKKILDKIKKQLKAIKKEKGAKLTKPIELYPVILLKVNAPKKKGIQIIGIGSKQKYITTQIK